MAVVPLTLEGTEVAESNHYRCDYPNCTKQYKKRCAFIEHQRTHTGEAPFRCPLCSKSFRRHRNLVQHAMVHSTAHDATYRCDFPGCLKTFKIQRLLRRHALIHTVETPFKCTEPGCQAAFAKETQLRRHMGSHSGKSMYPCTWPQCEQSFPTPSKLKRHLACHTNPKSYTCTACSIAFSTYLGLHQHLRTSHGDRLRIFCEQCKRVFHSQCGYRRHACTLNECSLCQKRFSKTSNYQAHVKAVHGTTAPCLCPSCGASLSSERNVQRHLALHCPYASSKHSTDPLETRAHVPLAMRIAGFDFRRKFSCHECTRTYLRQYDLDRHFLSCHNSEHANPTQTIADAYLESIAMAPPDILSTVNEAT